MASTSLTPNKKLRKLLVEKDESKSDTNIGDLPDELIHEILSTLPTKDAVRTSVLSKGWEHQWKEISKIELEEESPETRQHFIEFVEKILVECRNASCLKKFSLSFDVGRETARLNEWLSAFINPEIEELSLVLDRVSQPLVFPEHVFNNATLTKFQLSMPFVINLPASVYLQCLKVLILKHVAFPNGRSAQRLFSSCPLLEELTLVDIIWTNVRLRTACIACPFLKKLKIREWRDDSDEDDASDYEDESDGAQNGPTHCKIVVIGSNMTHFAYDGDLINDYYLYCTDLVVDASVEVHPPENFSRDAGYSAFMMLRAVTNAENLSITDSAAQALSRTPCRMVHVPLFERLNELRVVSSNPMDLSCSSLLTLFRNSPCLESIEFVMGVTQPDNVEDGEFSIDPLPACFGTHLKAISISGFGGRIGELKAIKYLLQVTPILETFYIYSNMYEFDSPHGLERLDQLYDLIVGFPTASEDCEVDLE